MKSNTDIFSLATDKCVVLTDISSYGAVHALPYALPYALPNEIIGIQR